MEQRQTPLARPQNAETRPSSVTNVYLGAQPHNEPNPSDGRQHGNEVEPKQNPGANPPPNGAEDVHRPIYSKSVPYARAAGGKAHYATPLASTLFARFDPRERRVQPAEHYVFQDRDFTKRGRI